MVKQVAKFSSKQRCDRKGSMNYFDDIPRDLYPPASFIDISSDKKVLMMRNLENGVCFFRLISQQTLFVQAGTQFSDISIITAQL
jgi:hypothetical protein